LNFSQCNKLNSLQKQVAVGFANAPLSLKAGTKSCRKHFSLANIQKAHPMKKKTWIIILTLAILGFCIYSTSAQPIFLPKGSGIPDREIVFSFYDDEGHHIGFINAVGSGLEKRQVKIPAGSFRLLRPLDRYTQAFHHAVLWSKNGDAIGMQYYYDGIPTYGIPFIIDRHEDFTYCSREISPRGTDIDSRSIQFTGENKIFAVENDATVASYDLETCERTGELYKAANNSNIVEAVFSEENWLALWQRLNGEYQTTILSPNRTVQVSIVGAEDPAWSKDGEYLAFVKEDGLYMIRRNGEDLTKLAAGYFYCPSWGPNGKQLVVEEQPKGIVIIDIASSEITTIFEGGRCPDWR
jgi:WD40-like Beta Propeller Repeat